MQSAAFSANKLKYLEITGLTKTAERPWGADAIVYFAHLADNQNRGGRDAEKARAHLFHRPPKAGWDMSGQPIAAS